MYVTNDHYNGITCLAPFVDGAASTFDIWLAAAEGDYSGMALISGAFSFMLPSDFAWGDSASKALSSDYDFDPRTDYVAEVTPGPLKAPGTALQNYNIHGSSLAA